MVVKRMLWLLRHSKLKPPKINKRKKIVRILNNNYIDHYKWWEKLNIAAQIIKLIKIIINGVWWMDGLKPFERMLIAIKNMDVQSTSQASLSTR